MTDRKKKKKTTTKIWISWEIKSRDEKKNIPLNLQKAIISSKNAK